MNTTDSPAFADLLQTNRMRIAALIVAISAIVAAAFAPDPAIVVLLIIPLVAGCAPQVVASESFSVWIDRWQATFQRIRDRGNTGGPVGRYFLRPLGAGSSALWRRTAAVQSPHLRAGVRILVLGYFWAIMIALLAVALYVIIGIVITILLLVAVFWILGHVLGGGSPSVTPSRVRAAFAAKSTGDDVIHQVGLRNKKVYAGTNWFNEELKGRVDDEGNIYKGTNWLNEEKIGRIDNEGDIYKGTSWLNEEKVGRIADDGTLYKGSNWFTEEKTGRVTEDGAIYRGTNWFNEEKTGRTGD